MTTSHNRRIRNTSYRYEDDLIGVWIGWGVSIIVYSISMIQVRNRVNLLLLLLWLVTVRPSISGWGCIHMIASRSSTCCWISLYMHDEDLLWLWRWWGVSIITYSMIQVRKRVNLVLPHWDCVRPSIYQLKVASIWPLTRVEGAETLYICINGIWGARKWKPFSEGFALTSG